MKRLRKEIRPLIETILDDTLRCIGKKMHRYLKRQFIRSLRFRCAFTDLYAEEKAEIIQMWNYSIENNP
jgi:hypothetical protein